MRLVFLFIIVFGPVFLTAQSHRYWTRSFNDESSLLAGACVGGGVGPSSIYYNPASISEAQNSSFSFNASLVSFEFFNSKNILGDDINIETTRAEIRPRFISYLIDPKNNKKFSLELSYLNNETYQQDYSTSVDTLMDILKSIPGNERYFALVTYHNKYRDDWFGVGGSWKVHPNLRLGLSLFVVVKSYEYSYTLDIEAYPLHDTTLVQGEQIPFYSANYQTEEAIHFYNYRLLLKGGALYTKGRVNIGLTIRTPSLLVFANGKRMTHKERQANISNPEGVFYPDYVIGQYSERKEMDANMKDPLSIAAGLTIHSQDRKKTLFATAEYFWGIDLYNFVEAPFNESSVGGIPVTPAGTEWMSFKQGALPVLNAAIGYRWSLRENLLVMGGFRTDFNYRPDDQTDDIQNVPLGIGLDVYHLSGGARLTIFGQDLILGLQYSLGGSKHQQQVVNLSDPVEYNADEQLPLQGTRQNTAEIFYNSVSIYFGATINFGVNKKE